MGEPFNLNAVPRALRDQLGLSEGITRVAIAADPGASATPSQPEAGPSTTPVVTAPEDVAPALAVTDLPAVPQEETPAAPLVNDELGQLRAEHARLQQAHSVLQGKYNAETRQMREQSEQDAKTIAQLQATVQELMRNQPIGERLGLSAEQIEGLGEENVAVIAAVAEKVASQRLSASEAKVAQLSEELARSAEDRYLQSLRAAVPDLDSINQNPAFVKWLQQPETANGVTRGENARRAIERRDSSAVAAYFRAFQASQAQKPGAAPVHMVPPGAARPGGPAQPPHVDVNALMGSLVQLTQGKGNQEELSKQLIAARGVAL